MIGPETKFLLDTNMLIMAANQFYHPDRSVTFWDELRKQIEAGSICILDVVADELIWRTMKRKMSNARGSSQNGHVSTLIHTPIR